MDVSQETGEVMLYMESACGLRPLIGWPDIDGMKDFADMLLNIYDRRNRECHRPQDTADDILKQVLGSDHDI
jgi:hypothetical protein